MKTSKMQQERTAAMGIRTRLLIAMSALFFAGCTPKIYVIDRQTVLEEEAAGRWPQFEKEVLNKSKAQGPTPFLKTPFNARREKLLSVLNGQLASAPAPVDDKTSAAAE